MVFCFSSQNKLGKVNVLVFNLFQVYLALEVIAFTSYLLENIWDMP